jgi:hypothetical protein
MQSIRRTFLALTVSLLAIVVGSGTAFAGPPPIEPAPATTTGGGSSSNGFLDSWPQVTLSILVIVAVLAFAVVAMPRLRHRSPTSATTA